MRSIYDYNDFCHYLNDYIQEYTRKSYGNRMDTFAASARIDPSTLSRILNRKRSLSLDMAEKIGRSAGLKKKRLAYFLLLVKMAKEKTEGGKSLVRSELEEAKSCRQKKIGPEQYMLFEKWYLLALRELIKISPINLQRDCSKAARLFRPPVTESQVRKGIRTLLDLQLAVADENGIVKALDTDVSTGDYWDSLTIHNYQREMATIAVSALDSIPRDERDFSTLVLGLSREGFAAARRIIKECRQRLLELEDAQGKHGDTLYHMNMHLFPVCTFEKDDRQ